MRFASVLDLSRLTRQSGGLHSRSPNGACEDDTMSKKSIIDVIGRIQAFRMMEKSVVAAAEQNREAGLTTASHINGETVFVGSKVVVSDDFKSRNEGFRRLTRVVGSDAGDAFAGETSGGLTASRTTRTPPLTR